MSKIDNPLRDKYVQRVILLEGFANLVVLTIKAIVGFSTGSMAVLADAIHSLTDIFNNIVAWIVVRQSAMPADREHPYGHRKFETLAVFGLASLLVVLAFEIASGAVSQEEAVVESEPWALGLMIFVLVANITISSVQRYWARRLNSDLLLADASHTFSDVLITLIVIIGWQLSAMGYVWLDRLCALGVAGLVFYLAYSLFKRVIPVLVDQFAVDPVLLNKTIHSVHGVCDVVRVRSRWIGSSCAVDMIITVDSTLSTEASHKIADNIEKLIEEQFQVTDISIHIEPESSNQLAAD